MFKLQVLASVLSLVAVNAAPAANDDIWFQPRDSPVAALFEKRAPSPSDPNFASNYPAGWSTPPTSSLPASWTAKLASIKLPGFSNSTNVNGYPTYANGESGGDQTICSFTYSCNATTDLQYPPAGVVALSFDDGPTAFSQTLYDFLGQNHIADHATHFMIGGNIVGNPTQMQAAAKAGGHIAVHTWSHPYMTTLTNEQILGELGWTIQIISDLNGGRIPAFWRPPFGDVDNRVRAIASGVFGLKTVTWNEDSADWAIGNNPAYTMASVTSTMTQWLSTPGKPGLCMLEHELNNNTINVFMQEYPVMVNKGWKIQNIAEAFGLNWYQNAQSGNTGNVTPMSVAQVGTLAAVSSSSTVSASSSAVANATSSSVMSTSSMISTRATSTAPVSTASVIAASTTSKASSADSRLVIPSAFTLVLVAACLLV